MNQKLNVNIVTGGLKIPCTIELFNKIINRGNKYIQDVAPGMMPEYRELFISGYCPTCWNEIFKEEG